MTESEIDFDHFDLDHFDHEKRKNKKSEFSLVLCSLIRIFSPCEKILTPKGMSVGARAKLKVAMK